MNPMVVDIGYILIAAAVGAAIFLWLLARYHQTMDDLQVESWNDHYVERIWDPDEHMRNCARHVW